MQLTKMWKSWIKKWIWKLIRLKIKNTSTLYLKKAAEKVKVHSKIRMQKIVGIIFIIHETIKAGMFYCLLFFWT
jgi:hypothetical protein